MGDESKDTEAVSPDGAAERAAQDALVRLMRQWAPLALICLAILAVLYTLYFASELFLPIFFAAFLSVVLRPLVRGMKRVGVPEAVGALLVLGCLVGSLVVVTSGLSPPVEEWTKRAPEIRREIETKLWPVKKSIEEAKEATEKIGNIADGDAKAAQPGAARIEPPSLLDRIFETTWLSLIQILITLALMFFFLARRTDQTKKTIRRLPWLERPETVEEMLETSRKSVARFLRISAVIYAGLGIVTTVAMAVLDMPYPVLWGILAFVFGFMPFVGPLIVFGCIGAVSLLSFDAASWILAPPLVYAVLTIVEGYFVTPAILGRQLTLSPIAVFLSMLLWTWIWGMPGALLSVPILVVATLLARHVTSAIEERETVAVGESQAPAIAADGQLGQGT